MYEAVFSDEFKKQLKRLKSKDKVMFDRVEKKVKQIILEPTHLKHLKNVLKGNQRVHLGPFVLQSSLTEDKVYFITFKHHDYAY